MITVSRSVCIPWDRIDQSASIGAVSYLAPDADVMVELVSLPGDTFFRRSDEEHGTWERQNAALLGTWREDGSGMDWDISDYASAGSEAEGRAAEAACAALSIPSLAGLSASPSQPLR